MVDAPLRVGVAEVVPGRLDEPREVPGALAVEVAVLDVDGGQPHVQRDVVEVGMQVADVVVVEDRDEVALGVVDVAVERRFHGRDGGRVGQLGTVRGVGDEHRGHQAAGEGGEHPEHDHEDAQAVTAWTVKAGSRRRRLRARGGGPAAAAGRRGRADRLPRVRLGRE